MHNLLPSWLIAGSMAIGATAGLCTAALAAIPEASGDACKLLTAAQVSSVLGVQFDEGAYTLPGNSQFCTWTQHNKSEMTAQCVQVNCLTTRQYEAPKTGPLAKGSENGLGEDAYWAYSPGTGFTLSVKKGSTYFRVQSRLNSQGVARKSDTSADEAKWNEKQKTIERAIGSEVLKKL